METTKETIQKVFSIRFDRVRKRAQERMLTIYTGPGGMDKFDELMEYEWNGAKRIYATKFPRFLIETKKFKVFKSRTGKKYIKAKS